jgi:hypothetical protein
MHPRRSRPLAGALLLGLTTFASAALAQGVQPAPTGAGVEEVMRQIIGLVGVRPQVRSTVVDRLAADVQAQSRDDVWATDREKALREAFSSSDMGKASLRQIDCRRTMCAISVALPSEVSPEARVRSLQAVEQWIAWGQPCGYAIVPEMSAAGGGGEIKVVVDCDL